MSRLINFFSGNGLTISNRYFLFPKDGWMILMTTTIKIPTKMTTKTKKITTKTTTNFD